MRRFPFVHVDVFTDLPLCGNGLTVFIDARGLSDAELLALGRETRQAETTFVFPGADPALVRVRIFTVSQELPFAGHPTLGTAAVLRSTSSLAEIVLELNVGPIPVRFEARDGATFGEMQQNAAELGEVIPHAEAAKAANLARDLLDASLPVQRSTTGLPFLIVPLRDRAALKSARPSAASMDALLTRTQAQGLYLVVRGEEPGIHLHARMFDGSGEDPATGSAAGACTGWMLRHGLLTPDTRAVIAQGDELHRPSRIHVRFADGAIRVGGNVIEVARGQIEL